MTKSDALRASIDAYDNFDQIGLAQKIEKNMVDDFAALQHLYRVINVIRRASHSVKKIKCIKCDQYCCNSSDQK